MLVAVVALLLCSVLFSTAAAADLSAALLAAAAQGRTEQVKTLVNAGVGLEVRDKSGRTPLMLAAQHGQVDTVGWLLSKGAQTGARDNHGWTAYALAASSAANGVFRKGPDEVMKILPRPAPVRLIINAGWVPENLISSCFMDRERLLREVDDILPGALALRAFESVLNASGSGLVQVVQSNVPSDADAVLDLQVQPAASCMQPSGLQPSGDSLSLSIAIRVFRAPDHTLVLKKTFGGGLKGVHAQTVANPSQYAAFYEKWIKAHTDSVYRNVVAALIEPVPQPAP